MVASTDIKFYTNANINAPALSDSWGSIIDVLDACLVNGFGSQTVSTLTASGTTATATFGSAHNFMQHQVIKIAGATQTEYNGEHRILSVPNANSITFQLAAAPSVTTATGAITCSLPALGWEKKYSGVNKAVYKPNNGLTPIFLRVDDSLPSGYTESWAKSAKITVSDSMLDVDTFDGNQMPFDAANPNLNHVFENNRNGWFKWPYSVERSEYYGGPKNHFTENEGGKSSATRWMVVGSADLFYIIPGIQTHNDVVHVFGFGKVKNLLNGTDNYALWVNDCYHTVNQQIYYESIDTLSGNTTFQPNCYLFFDKGGMPNYKRVQHFTTSLIQSGLSKGFNAAPGTHSGTVDVLRPYSETGVYYSFDVIGFSESLPAFKLPHIKGMAQIGSQFNVLADGFVSICTVEISGFQPSYLVNVLEK